MNDYDELVRRESEPIGSNKKSLRSRAESWWRNVQQTDPTADYGSWFQVGGWLVGYRAGFHDGRRRARYDPRIYGLAAAALDRQLDNVERQLMDAKETSKELQRDALRYRFIRKWWCLPSRPFLFPVFPEHLDTAIDEAMRESDK